MTKAPDRIAAGQGPSCVLIVRRARDSNPRGACTPSGFQERTTHRSDLLRYRTGSSFHHHLTTKALQVTLVSLSSADCCDLLHAAGSAIGASGASGG